MKAPIARSVTFAIFLLIGLLVSRLVPRVAALFHAEGLGADDVSRKRLPENVLKYGKENIYEACLSKSLYANDCSEQITNLDPDAVRVLLSRFESAFWQEHPNRLPIVRSSASRLSSTVGPLESVRVGIRVFRAIAIDAPTRNRLLTAWAASAFENRQPSQEEIEVLLKETGQELGFAVLEGYLNSTNGFTPADRYKLLLSLAKAAGWTESPRLNQRFAVLSASSIESSHIPEFNAFLKSLSVEGTNSAVVSEILKNLMLTDSSRALVLLVSIANSDPLLAAGAAFDAKLSIGDVRQATSQMSEAVRATFLSYCAKQLWGQSPLEVLRFTETFPPTEMSSQAVGEVAANLLPLGGERVKQWLDSLTPEAKAKSLKDAFSQINSKSRTFLTPDAMKAWLDAAEGSNSFGSDEVQWAVAIAAQKFDLLDLRKAPTLVPVTDKDAVETGIFASVSERLARLDPTALRNQVESAPIESKEKFLAIAASSIASVDYKAALDWRRNTDNPAVRAALDDGLIGFGSAGMPIGLRKEICLQRLKEMPDWKAFEPVVNRLVQSYARTDPTQAVDILQGLPDSEARNQVIPNFVKTWAESDPVAASDWIAQMPDNKTRDLSVKELVMASRDDPEVAVQNAAGISDRTLRLESARSLIEAWKSLDPHWIGDLMQKASFRKEDQAELAKMLSVSK